MLIINDPNLLLGIISILTIVIVYFVVSNFFFKNSEEKENQVRELEKKVLRLEESIQQYEKEKALQSTQKTTSFVSEKINKIESLESEILRQKQKVQETIGIAQDAMHVKYEFLANIRHEVRTPMNSILSFAGMLTHELKDKSHLTYAKNILTSGRKMLTLLDDIIELSRLESGAFKIENSAVDVKTLFEDIVNNQMFLAYKRGLELTLKIDEKLPKSLMLDINKVTDILSNIIANALQFTRQGYVKVEVTVTKENSAENSVDIAIMIEDSGCGIDKKDHQKIFEIFEKREEGTTEEFQSTGLGLSINRKMARAMNGDIYLVSELQKGSVFTLKLSDIEVVLASAEEEVDEEYLDFSLIKPEGANVMVIDEKLNSMEIIRDAFMNSNIKVKAFDNPRDAISELKVKAFDIIFIDIDILTSDDNAVHKVLSNMSKAMLVSLTSKSLKEIDFLTHKKNLAGHLKKPISKVELFKISMKILNHEQTLSLSENSTRTEENEFKNINKSKIENFLKQDLSELERLHSESLSTNDLNSIKLFAQRLKKLATIDNITPFIEYADKLLEHVELFDIDVIHTMMSEYKGMLKRVKSL